MKTPNKLRCPGYDSPFKDSSWPPSRSLAPIFIVVTIQNCKFHANFLGKNILILSYLINRRRNAPDIPPISMDGVDLEESSCLDKLLGLKVSSDLKWNEYIACIAKNAARMVGSFYRARNYMTRNALLYLYKSQIRPQMEYCCHLWAGCCH